jgi:hypothetical protein
MQQARDMRPRCNARYLPGIGFGALTVVDDLKQPCSMPAAA